MSGDIANTQARAGKTSAYVLVATPLGHGGRGGIDRLMDAVRDEARGGKIGPCDVRFAATRGQRSIRFSPLYLASFLLRMAWLRARGLLDVVHINLSSHGSVRRKSIVARSARMLGVPYVVHLHGSRFQSFFDAADSGTQASVRQLFAGARRVIVLGSAWRTFVADRVPEAASRIVILANASQPLSRSLERRDGVRILFLGQVGARKGVPDLIRALARLKDVAGWRATIAGDGDVAVAREQAQALGLSAHVTFPGWVGPEEARALLVSSDILVLPSFDENLPMSVIEGMSAGLAVVATPVGAVEDIVRNGETGLLVSPGNSDELADALRRLVADERLRHALGDAARDFHRRNLEIGAYVVRLAKLWTEACR